MLWEKKKSITIVAGTNEIYIIGDARFDEWLGYDKFFIFGFVWFFQAVWVFCISLPVIFINGSDKIYDGLKPIDYVSIVFFAIAIVVEIAADVQKAVWVKKGRQGGFCQGR